MIKNRTSKIQNFLWLDQKLSPNSPKYNVGGFAIINGNIEFPLFKRAISIFAENNPIFRSYFREESGTPFTLTNDNALEKGIVFFEKDSIDEAVDLITKDFNVPFDVEKDEKLFNIWLIKVDSNSFIWYTKLHHLIADGFSFQLLFNEISTNYDALAGSAQVTCRNSTKTYQQHVIEEQEYYDSEFFLKDREHWKLKYTELPDLIYNRQYQDHHFYDKAFHLPNEHLEILQLICKREGVNMFNILLASFSFVLSRFYSKQEINIGTPILNRLSRADRKVFGLFINVLPLQINLETETSFLDLIRQVKTEVFGMLRHQKFQQAEIIKALSYKGNRLYDVRISYESFNYQKSFSNYEAEIVALSNFSEEDPISVHIMDYNNDGLEFRFDINGSYVPEYIAEEFIISLQYILENVSELLDQDLKAISIVNPKQKQLISEISIGDSRELIASNFNDLWKENSTHFSTRKALIFKDESLNYEETEIRINQVTTFLQNQGIGKGDRVGILLDRSINVIPTILGLMRSGAVYVPIDKSFPKDRIDFIIEDSEIKLLITDDAISQISCNHSLIQEILNTKVAETTEAIAIYPEDEAYIIYTSGSTGKPKGVSIKHESLVDYTTTFAEYFKLKETDCVIQQSSFVFDTSIEEIFPILSTGGTLAISENPKDFHNLLRECSTNKVTLLSSNPFVVQYLNENHKKYDLSLRIVISGGDLLRKEQVNNLLDVFDIYNTYGPTESTVCATYHKVTSNDSILPIGKPITNRKVFVVNDGQLLPKGGVGEIVLGGIGLANAYLNNESLTKLSFVEIDGERVYKTGDLGQWDDQNNLIFRGRNDNQLSFRGYRIEAEEIEKAIKEIEVSVWNCVVMIKELQGVPSLIAYLSSTNGTDSSFLTKELKKKLPPYMIPNHIVILNNLPLNTSGKVDKKKLPLPKMIYKKKEVVLPSSEIEHEIANIWKQLLSIEEVDIHSNFFEIGGHSLLANQFIGIIRENRKQDISLKEFYEAPTIHEIVKVIETKVVSDIYELHKAPKQELYPLSFPQERLWFLDQLNAENKSYYVPRAIKMTGKLNLSRIEKVFTLLTEKHEILRTVFPVVGGIPFQKVLDPYYFHIPLISLEGLSKEDQDERIKDFILKEGNLHFDLESGPLLRVHILQKSKEDNLLIFCEHHLIHDGWTQGILLREFIDIYSKLIENENYEIEVSELQFKDFAYWQKSFFSDQRLAAHMSFWKEKLDGHIPVLPLPQKNKRPQKISGNGKLLIKTIDEKTSDLIRKFSSENGLTLFITMLAAFKVTLSRYSNESDICVGTAVANRRLASIENILGMVINTIALRTEFAATDSLGEVLDKVKNTCFEAYTHEDTPFGKVVEHIAPKRSLGLMPLFQYMFSFMNTPSRNLFLPNLELEILDSHNLSAKFDINVVVVTPFEQARQEGMEENNRTIIVEWEYNSDIYSEDTMNQMLDAYFNVLETMVTSPHNNYKEVSCITADQQKELLERFNDTHSEYPKDKSIVDLFIEQVAKTPENIALVYEDKKVTYLELDEMSNSMANYLLSQFEIKKDAIIGIKQSRSEWMVVSMLAVLKIGAAYVSIDPSYPEKRIDFIKKDSNCKIVIDDNFIQKFAIQTKEKDVPNVEVSSSNLAYIIYTSGSTGKPKGVMVEHGNLVNFLSDYKLDIHNTSLTCKTIFDVSVFEIMGSITSGSTLFIPNEEIIYHPAEYADFLNENRISHCYIHPMHLEIISEQLATKDDIYLKKILIGVEGIKPHSVKWYYENGVEILNAYGPTECTICSTKYKVESLEQIKTPNIPIGKPLQNYQVFILDQVTNRLQPKGVIGELCVSGTGLARGYLNSPELTKEKFIKHPFNEDQRLYKTGDLARWLPDGNIEFIGRKDTQVKIRGYRIELGEIEFALMSLENISQAVVTISEHNHEKYIVAYVVNHGEFDEESLKLSIGDYLPEYMIPNFMISLSTLPLTPNGKIDKNGLPKVVVDDFVAKEYVAPRNEIEQKLTEIWQDVLKVEKVGITNNFFELGGHSLKITQLINRMNKELSSFVKVRDVFTNPTIASLSKKIIGKEYTSIPVAPFSSQYPLSSAQRRLWVLSQFEGGNRAYNIPGVFAMKGKLEVDILNEAFHTLIGRHESLRTRFIESSDDLYQQILEEKDIKFIIEREDVSEDIAQDLIKQFYQEEFNLSQAPLLRVRLLKTGESSFYLLFAIHHIIGDGWSMEVFTKELMYVYNQLVRGNAIVLPELKIQYKDYILWLASDYNQKQLSLQGDYWKKKLSGELPVLELPRDKKRPPIKTYNGSTKLFNFSREWRDKLKSFGNERDATLYMMLMAGINGLFYRYTGSSDIILGTPIAGRSHQDLEHQFGLYLNTLAIRTTFEGEESFTSLLNRQRQTLVEAYAHQDYPFDRLVGELELRRDTSHSALFDVMVVMQNQKEVSIELDDLQINSYQEISRSVSQFDMTFSFSEEANGIQLRLEYNSDIYSMHQMEALCIHLELFLDSAINSPEESIGTLTYLTEEEEKELLYTLNNTRVEYPRNKSVLELFGDQVSNSPDAIAMVFDNGEMTYQELDLLSNALSNDLLATGLVEKESLIGIELARNEWLVISMMAVLKAGGAYIPIDPTYPEQRIEYIKEDSQCALVISEAYIEEFKQKQKIDTAPEIKPDSNQLAYVIYTSGSTGKPKGVMIEHQNMMALIHWSAKEFDESSFDIVYFSTSHCFDLSIFEVFYTLSIGKTIRVLENGLSIPKYLKEDTRVLVNTVPSVVQSFIDDKVNLSNVSILNLAGEVIPPQFTKSLPLTSMDVYNLYGPSEDTTYSTYYKIEKETEESISIGNPIGNTQVYIVNEKTNQLQPKGVVGELCISGFGLTRGYLNRPELTQKKYIAHPFKEGERLYKTGDLARWMPDNTLEFRGRKDNQVKLRGYRIELGEIEYALTRFTNVAKAVVIIKEYKKEKYLTAFVVGENNLDTEHIKNSLRTNLPQYMIPNHIYQLDVLPLTPNGKIDRNTLSDIHNDNQSTNEFVAPRNDIENQLAAIWQDVLNVERVGIKDNFFELGGHSLSATNVISKIYKLFSIRITIKEFYNGPTIQSFGVLIESKKKTLPERIPLSKPSNGEYEVSNEQFRVWLASQTPEGSKAHNIVLCQWVEGNLDIDFLKHAIVEVVQRHEILRTSFAQKDDGVTYQIINDEVETLDEVLFLKSISTHDFLDEIQNTFFPLDAFPLFKIFINKNEEGQIFTIVMHHSIGDMLSFNIFLKEIIAVYSGLLKGKEITLPTLNIQYKDYSAWINQKLRSSAFKESELFWAEYLDGLKKESLWYGDAYGNRFEGAILENNFSADTFSKIRAVCQGQNQGLMSFIAVALGILIYKTQRQNDIVIGVPVSLRNHPDLMNQMGLYLNLLPLKIEVNETQTKKEILNNVGELQKEILDHSFYPFNEIANTFEHKYNFDLSSRIDIYLNVINHSNIQQEIPGDVTFSAFELKNDTSKFPICLYINEYSTQITYRFEYQTALFTLTEIEGIEQRFLKIIHELVDSPQNSIQEIEFIEETKLPSFKM